MFCVAHPIASPVVTTPGRHCRARALQRAITPRRKLGDDRFKIETLSLRGALSQKKKLSEVYKTLRSAACALLVARNSDCLFGSQCCGFGLLVAGPLFSLEYKYLKKKRRYG